MTEQKDTAENFAKIFACCWKDEEFKARFKEDPSAVIAEHGMQIPEDLIVNVVENTGSTVFITLPSAPENIDELSDAELEAASGGATADTTIPTGVFHNPSSYTCNY